MRFHRGHYLSILIFLLALIVRLLVVLQYSDIPEGDAYVYDNLAVSLSQGKGYVNSDGTAHSWYPPFYPFFLSIIYRFFGHSYIAVKIIQSIIGALSCVFIFLIARRIHSAVLGILSSSISIFYLPFIKSAERLLSEPVFTFLLLLIVFYLLKMQEDKRIRNCIIVGLLSGIALLTRNMAILFPFFMLPVFIYSERGCFRNILKKYVVILLFFGLSISPWIIRNYKVHHRFIPSSAEGGIAFYVSYFPPGGVYGFSGASDPAVGEVYSKIQSPALRNEFLFKKTLDFIVNNPKKVIVLEFKKILYLWAPFDWEIVEGRWFNFPYVIMLPFFALGLFFVLKEFMKFYPVLLPIIYVQIMTLIFYGSPRFRLPIDPYIFIIAMLGILNIRVWVQKGNLR